jgi:hypothetical protein
MKKFPTSPARVLAGSLLVLVMAATGFAPAGRGLAASRVATPQKSLIYAGWYGNTTPTPSFIASHFDFLETQPFNGLVVYLRNASMTINASTGVMTNTPMTHTAIASVLDPIRDLPFWQLQDNFGFVMGNDPPDFFDDWSVPIQNFRNLAHALHDAGLKGFVFDNEQYFTPWANYPDGVNYGYTLAQYETQARLRGRQVMEAMVSEFPDIVVITLHGPYVSEPDAPWQLGFPQWQNGNELQGPFFAGFQEGRGLLATNVDGGELYDLRSATDFQETYSWRKYDLPSDAVNCSFIPPALRPSWPGSVSISFGVYDYPYGGQAMNPSILATTLTNALARADRWVWFYSEANTFLLSPSQGGAPQTWVDAVRSALPELSEPPPAAPPAVPPPAVATSSSSSEGATRSNCGLLGIEVVPLFLILAAWRRRRQKQS